MAKKALLIGGTGAMGVYLAPELLRRGYSVDVTSRFDHVDSQKKITHLKGNALDVEFIARILRDKKYDVVVDFMTYTTDQFRERYELYLKATKQYIFLSSYRVFADTPVITELSPRLLDVCDDVEYLNTDEYALAKARQEDMLRSSKSTNWTIVRPAITYSKTRFQFGTLEANVFLWRATKGLPIAFPAPMLGKVTTMTWAGDVARLMSKLCLNERAYGEDFNVATAENHTWQEVLNIYKKNIDIELRKTTTEQYILAIGSNFSQYQVRYDRMFDRKIDNSKVLDVTGESQLDFTKLAEGLEAELNGFLKQPKFGRIDYAKQARFDKLVGSQINLAELGAEDKSLYEQTRGTMGYRMKRLKSDMKGRMRVRTRLRKIRSRVKIRTRFSDARLIAAEHLDARRRGPVDGAILTLTGYFNYGNIVQRYALQEYLRQNGYNFVSYAREPYELTGDNKKRFLYTEEFVRTRILRKKFRHNDKQKTYIVGSDQVWRNWKFPNEKNEFGYYFFDFAEHAKSKKIAYAASFGQSSLEDADIHQDLADYVRPLINAMDAVSVREQSGVGIIKNEWNLDAKLVVDPTMLLDSSDYQHLIDESPRKLEEINGIFAYILAVDDTKQGVVRRVSKVLGENVDEFYPKRQDTLAPIEQWLKGFRDARFVVTDSFHGTVFAIINQTPFLVIENSYGGVARIDSLLRSLGLEDRIVSRKRMDAMDASSLEDIDWARVQMALKSLRDESGEWLLDALKREV